MSKYITRGKDHTGCHPVIAEHLMNNKEVKCIAWDNDEKRSVERWVFAFDPGSDFPYVTNGADYKNAKPIESKKVVKEFWPLMHQLEAGGYVPWCYSKKGLSAMEKDGEPCFVSRMFKYCGKEPNPRYTWLDQWLEEAE